MTEVDEEAAHARLSPSSAERWISCPASVRMADLVEPSSSGESVWAREGTAAHALGELKARLAFDMITADEYTLRFESWVKTYSDFTGTADFTEMDEHTTAYVHLLRERLGHHPESQLLLEQRLPTGLPDGGRGTSDAVIVSPEHVEIVDLKYGKGVAVEADGNPQLRIYAHGALSTYGDILGDTKRVRMTVHQPRLDHVLTEELDPADLRSWHASILPRAELALSPDAPFGPSDKACRWCPASGQCLAQLQEVFRDEPFEEDPALLTPEQMSETLVRVPFIRDWLKAFEEAALTRAYSLGEPIPGYKVVMSGGKRVITDHEAAIEALLGAGYETDQVAKTSARGIGDLEKLLGKETFGRLVSPFVKKTEGRPSLVPVDDRRTGISPNAQAQQEDWDVA